MWTNRFKLIYIFLLMVALSLACGFNRGSEPTPEAVAGEELTEPVAEEIPITNAITEPTPTNIETVMQHVKRATVQILTDASYIDVTGEPYSGEGSGSGFIIDSSGIVVTNNHVVTGARSLKVYVGGEKEPRNAKVLGVSECSDLAVIDIEGDDFSYLEWYDDPIYIGLDVYAAGYPLGDPEFTLTRGIVSKESADGQTSWASVDGVIEHDATINPGNSGGPLVTPDGKVVAVNYANRDLDEVGVSIQYFAIARDEARAIIEELRQGQDVLAVGLNGEAFVIDDEEGEISGIWVRSVQSGSSADKALIKGGDIITQLEGQALALAGTMSEYCDTLRSHNLEDTLSLEVVRLATGEVLEGQLNGRALETVREVDPLTSQSDLNSDDLSDNNILGVGVSSSYIRVTDDTQAIEMEIPSGWNEIDGSIFKDDDGTALSASIIASNNLSNFKNPHTPGLELYAFDQTIDPGQFLNDFNQSEFVPDDCDSKQRFENTHSAYTGYYDLHIGCGPANTNIFFMALAPKTPQNQNYFLFFMARAMSAEATAHMLDTFQVVGNLP